VIRKIKGCLELFAMASAHLDRSVIMLKRIFQQTLCRVYLSIYNEAMYPKKVKWRAKTPYAKI